MLILYCNYSNFARPRSCGRLRLRQSLAVFAKNTNKLRTTASIWSTGYYTVKLLYNCSGTPLNLINSNTFVRFRALFALITASNLTQSQRTGLGRLGGLRQWSSRERMTWTGSPKGEQMGICESISAAITLRSGRLAPSSRISSLSQNMSMLSLSVFADWTNRP